MNGPTHFAGGLATATAVSLVFSVDLKTGLIGAAIGAGAALIPDWFNIAFPGIELAGFEGHRGVSHWLLTALGVAYLFAGRWPGLWQYCLAGYCSHLFLDMLTERGIPLLGPLPMQFRVAPFRNGGAVDHIIGALSLEQIPVWFTGLSFRAKRGISATIGETLRSAQGDTVNQLGNRYTGLDYDDGDLDRGVG